RIRECQRYRTRRSVAKAVDVDDGALRRDAELLARVLDDAEIRLVRNVDVDVVRCEPALVEQLRGGRDEDARRKLEDLAAVHLHEVLPCGDRLRSRRSA